MPTYEYVCDACEHAFEEFQSMSSRLLRKCPACKKRRLRRLFGTGAGIIFKGSGFYETDYRKKTGGKERDADAKAKAGEKAGEKADGKPESKSEPMPGSKSEPKPESKSEPRSGRKPDAARKRTGKRD